MAPSRGHRFYIGFFIGRNMNNLLVWNHKSKSLDIRYEALFGGPLPSLFELDPWGQKWPRPGVACFT